MSRINLVLGATGAIGSAVVRELLRQDEYVRVLVREPDRVASLFPSAPVGVRRGSVADPDALAQAFEGIATVYNCINLPYPRWDELPAMHDSVLTQAARAGARMVFPGNVYNYGHPVTRPVSEDHPQAPHTKKGRLRVRIEEAFWKAHGEGRVPVFILRLPDFYGPNVVNNLIKPIFTTALRGGWVNWPGDSDAEHEFVFIEDAGRAMVDLAHRDAAFGQAIHLPGRVTTARRWLRQIFEIAGTPLRGIRAFGSTIAWALGLANREVADLREMLYLFEEPLVLDGTKYRMLFGDYPSTPFEKGIEKTLAWFRAHSND